MPRVFDDGETRQWLMEYDQGSSAKIIASKRNLDIRVVKRTLDRLIMERESRQARLELLKEALIKHSQRLASLLKNCITATAPPDIIRSPLPWYHEKHGEVKTIFNIVEDVLAESRSSKLLSATAAKEWALLKQHLKHDRLWRLVTDWEKAYSAFYKATVTIQYEVKNLLEQHTGLTMTDAADLPSYVVSSTTGDILYQFALRRPAVSVEEFSGRITAETDGSIRRHSSILAYAPGQEPEVKDKIIEAYGALLKSPAIEMVVSTFKTLSGAGDKVRDRIEDILLLDLIPGTCRVCSNFSL